jgi:sugar phosphate isomerase/epimerase
MSGRVLPEDLLDKLRDARRLGYALPSDIEMIVGELIRLRSEIEKIRKALEKHGIKVD